MKIGLITFHNALNYGAALQTYATQRYLNDISNQCIIIDYVNKERKNAYSMPAQILMQIKERKFNMALRMVAGSLFMELRRNNFSKFYNYQITKTDVSFNSIDQISKISNEFDFFMVGSDQVWNPVNNGGDMTYLLEFVQNKEKTISYASSFGASNLPENLVEDYRRNLNAIKYLSTREQMGVEIIETLTKRDARLVLDPVFLLDKQHWIKLSKKAKKVKHKFIFSYTNRKNQFENMVKKSKINLQDYKVHKISRFIRPSDFISPKVVVDYYITPEQFISNIYNSDLVATASFHCVAFSIILNKKFVVFLTGDKGKDERILNLLKITGLTNRIYNDSMTESEIFADIDYLEVNKKLSPHIEESRKFLKDIFHPLNDNI